MAKHLQEVRSGVGSSYGCAEFALKEAATVRAEHLDRLLRCEPAHRDLLRRRLLSSITGLPLSSFSG